MLLGHLPGRPVLGGLLDGESSGDLPDCRSLDGQTSRGLLAGTLVDGLSGR